MFLSSISLKNIRKHTDSQFDFTDKINYIIGGNGVGKTSVLEAIYYLSTTKSCVASSDTEAVKLGENNFIIQGRFEGLTNDRVQVEYSSKNNKKSYSLNGKAISKFSDIFGKFPVVLLSPADHTITQGYPADRRRFVDSVISQANRTYLKLLIDYNQILKQRASLLSRIRENNSKKNNELDVWTEKLISAGVEIIRRRASFITEFESYIKESYEKILSDSEVPRIIYHFLNNKCSDNLYECFEKMIYQKEEDEIRRGVNLVGPHRDDYIFSINDMSLKSYGSQGQHKTFQAMLKFAEYFYLKDKKGISPLFLLDDVFGELDSERAKAISNYLSTIGQAIITLTDFANISFLNIGKEDKVITLSANSEVLYA